MAGRFYLEMTRIFGELPNKALARELGIDHTSIIQWKRGAEPSRDTIRKICERKGWSTTEYDRLNRIAEGIPEGELSRDDFTNLVFGALAGHSTKNFSPHESEKILQIRRDYIDALWEATPPATEKEMAEYYASEGLDDLPDTGVLESRLKNQEAHIKALETEIKKRDARITSLEAQIEELKAEIGGPKQPPAVRVRRKK